MNDKKYSFSTKFYPNGVSNERIKQIIDWDFFKTQVMIWSKIGMRIIHTRLTNQRYIFAFKFYYTVYAARNNDKFNIPKIKGITK